MLRRVTAAGVATLSIFFSAASRQFSTRNPVQPFPRLTPKRRSKLIHESQKALAEHLHATCSLPYPYADYIATNSPRSLWEVVSRIPRSPSTSFTHAFHRYLRYHPINELEFFLESIGLSNGENELPPSVLPPNSFFIFDWKHFKVACALAGMGFPWNKLGLLYKEDCSVFKSDALQLRRTIGEIKDVYGFNSDCVVGICLSFPRVLYANMDGLLTDLKILLLNHELLTLVDGNHDVIFELCEKIRLFYDLGCEMIGELMGRSKSIFVDYSKEALVRKIDYFSKLGVGKDQVGLLLLSRPEVFGFDTESRVISISGFLKQLGLSEEELKSLKQRYPHVFGRNKMVNLPCVIRSLDLSEWFLERMKSGCHTLLCEPVDEDLDENYTNSLVKIQVQKTRGYSMRRLNFLHSIGFGENMFAIKALAQLKGSASQLQQRFDFLLCQGVLYPNLCRMVRFRAKILNQTHSILGKKLEFLCTEMGLSVQFLDIFPGYLIYNLEKRIKPRYRLHKWLVDQGLCKKKYTVSTMIVPSDKVFVDRISRIHPPSAKKWLENSLNKQAP